MFEVVKTSNETVGKHVENGARVVGAEVGDFAKVAGELLNGEVVVVDK